MIILISIPYFFKDKIVKMVANTINTNINAHVTFKDANLSLFKSFPLVSLTVDDLAVANKTPFVGDTLFNAGVGHCRSGNAEILYQTISQQFHRLADNVVVYPGHDYLENNLRFTLSLEADNLDAQAWLQRAVESDPTVAPITTCIGDERLFNSFFRLDSPEVRKRLDCLTATDEQVFVALRSLRDIW